MVYGSRTRDHRHLAGKVRCAPAAPGRACATVDAGRRGAFPRHGGIAAVACASGSARSRVQQGVAELERGEEPTGRLRRPGAGRKAVAQTDPGVVDALLSLVEPTRRGDPESALCWTTLSLKRLVGELAALGHHVSTWTVSKLLQAQGFSLQANTKKIEGHQHPNRDG